MEKKIQRCTATAVANGEWRMGIAIAGVSEGMSGANDSIWMEERKCERERVYGWRSAAHC